MAEGYNYNAIAEHPIIPEFDETYKWKWNGALLDLSELPFEEYTKTIFQTSGSGGGGSTGSTGSSVVTNSVTLSYENTGSTYELVATMQYPSDTDITVSVNVEGESGKVSITVPAGSLTGSATLTRPSSDAKPAVTSPSISPVRDENYRYQVVLPEIITEKFKCYYGTKLASTLNNIDSNTITSMSMEMIDNEGTLLKFIIPRRDKENITAQEAENYKYGLVLAIPKGVYDGESYELLEHAFQDKAVFDKLKDIVIGTASFTVLTKTSDGMQYLARYANEIEYDFDIKYME
jgi:hypothetical protein